MTFLCSEFLQRFSDSAYKIICNKNNQIACDQKNIFRANFPFFLQEYLALCYKTKKVLAF